MTTDEMKMQRDGQLSYGRSRASRVDVDRGKDEMDYCGQKRCGCVVTWCSSAMPPLHRNKELRRWERDGLEVIRVTTEEARTRLRPCKCAAVQP
jgi:hypothetical protein